MVKFELFFVAIFFASVLSAVDKDRCYSYQRSDYQEKCGREIIKSIVLYYSDPENSGLLFCYDDLALDFGSTKLQAGKLFLVKEDLLELICTSQRKYKYFPSKRMIENLSKKNTKFLPGNISDQYFYKFDQKELENLFRLQKKVKNMKSAEEFICNFSRVLKKIKNGYHVSSLSLNTIIIWGGNIFRRLENESSISIGSILLPNKSAVYRTVNVLIYAQILTPFNQVGRKKIFYRKNTEKKIHELFQTYLELSSRAEIKSSKRSKKRVSETGTNSVKDERPRKKRRLCQMEDFVQNLLDSIPDDWAAKN